MAHWRWVAMSAKSEATKQAVFTYPAEIPPMLKLSDKEFARELWFLGVAKLYELGRLSSGKAARLAGLDRVSFLHELQRVGVSAINLRDEEVEAEIQAAKDLAG
jgi:predicted HTH domain antitoxin